MLLPSAGIETDPVFVALFGLLCFVGGSGRGWLETAGTGSEGGEGAREERTGTTGTARTAGHSVDEKGVTNWLMCGEMYPCVTSVKARISALDTAASFDLPVKYLRTCRCLSYAPKKAESDNPNVL
jgi:hypothetical protein